MREWDTQMWLKISLTRISSLAPWYFITAQVCLARRVLFSERISNHLRSLNNLTSWHQSLGYNDSTIMKIILLKLN